MRGPVWLLIDKNFLELLPAGKGARGGLRNVVNDRPQYQPEKNHTKGPDRGGVAQGKPTSLEFWEGCCDQSRWSIEPFRGQN